MAAYTMDGKTAWEYPLPVASIPFGSGTSPVVHGGLVLLSRDGKPESVVYALNARDGSLKWKAPVSPGAALAASHATPTIWNGQAVIHGFNAVTGLDLRDGAHRWSLSTTTNGTATPVSHLGMLYVPGWSNVGDASYLPPLAPWPEMLASYDKDKDDRLSKDEVPADFFVMKRPELPDAIPGAHVSVKGIFFAFDPDKDGYITGKEWQETLAGVTQMIKQHGLLAVRAGGEGDITTTHVAWKESRNVPEVPSPVLHREKVYLVTNGGIVSCLNAKDGRVVFRGRLGAPGEYYASPVAADGRLYFTSRSGIVTVIEAGEEIKILARNDLKEDVFASPAIVGDTLYIRTTAHVYAFRATRTKD
jgi:outer membrane protein assembly factor BamB